VLIDPVKAKGRRDLVDACPYGAVWWNEEPGLPQHWTFDAHLLDSGWKEPRASQACPTAAIRAMKCSDEAMQEMAAHDRLEVLDPGKGTRPRVHYRNLHRFNKAFVGGSIVARIDGADRMCRGRGGAPRA
jgi:Fe-S-cluster-containing dehydrogenase component